MKLSLIVSRLKWSLLYNGTVHPVTDGPQQSGLINRVAVLNGFFKSEND